MYAGPDRVAVMEQGELVQVGSPQDVYDRPGSPFVYDFLGGANRVACRVAGGRVLVAHGLIPSRMERCEP